MEIPFNHWTHRHVQQGFAWREGSVSFRTIAEDGQCTVVVAVVGSPEELDSFSPLVIEVPFDVPKEGALEVASIADVIALNIPEGHYTLRFECLAHELERDKRPIIKLTFMESHTRKFRVLFSGKEFSASENLLINADPAI